MPITQINITNDQNAETNVNWYNNDELADLNVLNRPIKEISTVVNEVIVELNSLTASFDGDADLLEGENGAFYRNANNINAGTLSDDRLPATISSDITGNAATATLAAEATILETARTITLNGDVTGSVSFDGSGNVTLTTTVIGTGGAGYVLDTSAVDQHIIASTDATYDIGSSTIQWNDIFAEQFIESSSLKIKKNIFNMSYNLDTIMQMRPVEYDKIKSNNHEIGFIAEEMDLLIPEVVAKDDNGDAVGIDYARLVSVCVKAIQELKAEIEELKSK